MPLYFSTFLAMAAVNGVAHVILTVRSVAHSAPFYRWLGGALGISPVIDADDWLYLVGGRTALGIAQADPPFSLREGAGEAQKLNRENRFVQRRCGLHHMCFRMRSREAVETLHAQVREYIARGQELDDAALRPPPKKNPGDGDEEEYVRIVHAPEEGAWAPGYYSLLIEDPDGIRIEFNFVPGTGLLDAHGAKARSPGAGMPSETAEQARARL
jgi:catechol 2,3-dioxygenase-like lactoylglutathione lyase family enzyme